MIITEFDGPLTAEDARKIALNNRDDCRDRSHFREIMQYVKHAASFGQTRWTNAPFPKPRCYGYSQNLQDALRSMGYKVTEKRAMQWDSEAKDWSEDKPSLDNAGREQFFLEITWG